MGSALMGMTDYNDTTTTTNNNDNNDITTTTTTTTNTSLRMSCVSTEGLLRYSR